MTSDDAIALLFSGDERWTELVHSHEEEVLILKAINPAWLTTENLSQILPGNMNMEYAYVAHAFAYTGLLHLIPLDQITDEVLQLKETYQDKTVLTLALHANPATLPQTFITFKNLKDEFEALFDSQQIRDLPITADLAAHFPEINKIVHDYINQLRKKAIDYENWLPRGEEKTHHIQTRQLRIEAARTWLARVARFNLEHPRQVTIQFVGRALPK